MVFSSIAFLFYFFPVFLFVYFILPTINLKNLWILVGSLFFYFWGEGMYTSVLIFSIVINYVFGRLIEKNRNKTLLGIGIALNLLILIFYKYSYFLAESFFSLTQLKENNILGYLSTIHLPLGISFFTFQGVSYLLDVYRKEAGVEKNIANTALYIAMFPQLIAGPIVRYKTIADQIKERVHSLPYFNQGICLFIIGLAYKVLIANKMGSVVDQIFDLPIVNLSPLLAWTGVISYTFQIYFDFCGYSVMAIGIGYMLGFFFPINFNYPYISQSITDFWRRWHLTLSHWFRDYLYISLGGNRKGKWRTYFNLFVVFTLCGIWHGAAWVFLIWGLYQGFFLIIERIGLGSVLKKLPRIFRHLYSITVFVYGWLIFRSESVEQLQYFTKTLFSNNNFTGYTIYPQQLFSSTYIIAFVSAIIFSTPLVHTLFFTKNECNNIANYQENIFNDYLKYPLIWYASLGILFIICISNLANLTYNPFIYFRF